MLKQSIIFAKYPYILLNNINSSILGTATDNILIKQITSLYVSKSKLKKNSI